MNSIGKRVEVRPLGEGWSGWCREGMPGQQGVITEERVSVWTGTRTFCVAFDKPIIGPMESTHRQFWFEEHEVEVIGGES
jgi:hypothetical protein